MMGDTEGAGWAGAAGGDCTSLTRERLERVKGRTGAYVGLGRDWWWLGFGVEGWQAGKVGLHGVEEVCDVAGLVGLVIGCGERRGVPLVF